MTLPHIKYINLDRSVDRNASLLASLSRFGITDFTRFSAIDRLPEEWSYLTQTEQGKLLCSLSHLYVMKEIDESSHNVVLVMEDDTDLQPMDNWTFSWEEFMERLPKGWGAVQLYRNSVYWFPIGALNFSTRGPGFLGTCAYVVTKQHAKMLVDNFFVGEEPDLHKVHMRPMTDSVVFDWPNTYSVSLFSTQEVDDSTIRDTREHSALFEHNAAEVVRLWRETPPTLDQLMGFYR